MLYLRPSAPRAATILFGAVHGQIRMPQQHPGFDAIPGPSADAERCFHADHMPGHLDGTGELREQARCHVLHLVIRHAGQNDSKFVTAQTGCKCAGRRLVSANEPES